MTLSAAPPADWDSGFRIQEGPAIALQDALDVLRGKEGGSLGEDTPTRQLISPGWQILEPPTHVECSLPPLASVPSPIVRSGILHMHMNCVPSNIPAGRMVLKLRSAAGHSSIGEVPDVRASWASVER